MNKKPVIFEAVRVEKDFMQEVMSNIFSEKVLVVFSSILRLTYEIKYFYEDSEDTSK